MSNVKIAYLINAHKNFDQLARLIGKLDHENVDFYLHIDKKVKESDFLGLANRLSGNKVRFVNPRVDVSWGGFTQVEATLNGLAVVLQGNVEYEVINFLSGQDYPLKSNAELFEFFAGRKGREFIDYIELTPAGWAEEMYRYDRYHLSELIGNRHVRRACECLLNVALSKRKMPKGYLPYAGSTWWSISPRLAGFIVEFVKENPAFKDFFKLTHAPDEMFFQTIVMNSRYKASVCNDNLRYLDWQEGKANPKILTEHDFHELSGSGKLFARKFDVCEDALVLDLIDDATR